VLLATLVFFGLTAGCSDPPETTQPNDTSSVVIGVSADQPLKGVVQRVELRVATGFGDLLFEESLPFAPPMDIEVPALADKTNVTATIVAYGDDDEPLLKRIAATAVAAQRTLLLPLRLNDECVSQEGEPDVTCTGSTCSAGNCQVPFISAHLLDDYAPSWSEPPVGKCGPVDSGEPQVVIGFGDPPFEPMADNTLITPYTGAQGGTHFFFSVRMSNADEVTGVTTHFGTILSTGRERTPVKTITKFDVGDDGCHAWTIPFVMPPVEYAGELMRLGVTVTDVTGNAGHTHVDVLLGAPQPP
jgi:hypothetical protein